MFSGDLLGTVTRIVTITGHQADMERRLVTSMRSQGKPVDEKSLYGVLLDGVAAASVGMIDQADAADAPKPKPERTTP